MNIHIYIHHILAIINTTATGSGVYVSVCIMIFSVYDQQWDCWAKGVLSPKCKQPNIRAPY